MADPSDTEREIALRFFSQLERQARRAVGSTCQPQKKRLLDVLQDIAEARELNGRNDDEFGRHSPPPV